MSRSEQSSGDEEFLSPDHRIPDEDQQVDSDNSLHWDSYQEQLSFSHPSAESSPVEPEQQVDRQQVLLPAYFSDDPESHLAVWPPPALSSETDNNILEAGDIPIDNLDPVVEEEEEDLDEVFETDKNTETDTMPPKKSADPEELYRIFSNSMRIWDNEVKRLKNKGAKENYNGDVKRKQI